MNGILERFHVVSNRISRIKWILIRQLHSGIIVKSSKFCAWSQSGNTTNKSIVINITEVVGIADYHYPSARPTGQNAPIT